MFWDAGSPICLSKTQLSCKSGEGAHLSEGVNSVGWDTNHSIIYPLFFGFSFLLPELKKRKEPLTDVTFESSVTENGGPQVPKPGLCFSPGCLQSDSWHPVL